MKTKKKNLRYLGLGALLVGSMVACGQTYGSEDEDEGTAAAARSALVPDGGLKDGALPDAQLPPDAALPDAALPDAAVPDANAGDAGPAVVCTVLDDDPTTIVCDPTALDFSVTDPNLPPHCEDVSLESDLRCDEGTSDYDNFDCSSICQP